MNFVRTIESAALVDYQNGAGDSVARKFAGIAANIGALHRLFDYATSEMLEYWKDQNPARVDSGSRTLKRCALLMDKTIATMNAMLKSELRAASCSAVGCAAELELQRSCD